MNIPFAPNFAADPLVLVVTQVSLILVLSILASWIFNKSASTKKCILIGGLLGGLFAPIVFLICSSAGIEFGILSLPHSEQPDSYLLNSGQGVEPRLGEPIWESTDLAEPPIFEKPEVAEIQLGVAASAEIHPTQRSSFAVNLETIRNAVGFVWLLFSGIGLAVVLNSFLRLRRLLLKSEPLDETRFAIATEEVRSKFCLAHFPRINISDGVSSPAAIGVGRVSWIVIPRKIIDSISNQQLVQILIHETAHIAKRDTILQVLGRILLAIWWWNPLAYLLVRRLAQSQEEVCDNVVLANADAEDYGRTLLELGKFVSLQAKPFATAFLITRGWRLEDRIKEILEPGRNKTGSVKLATWLFVSVAFSSLAIATSAAKVSIQENAVPVSDQPAQENETDQQKSQRRFLERKEMKRKQSDAQVLYILDGYIGLSDEQQAIVSRLVLENRKLTIGAGISYNWFPKRIMQSINTPEFRNTLTERQMAVFDSLEEKAFDLMTQVNSMVTQAKLDWARQPFSMLNSAVQLRIERLNSILQLNDKQKASLISAGEDAVREILEARKLLYERYSSDAAAAPGNIYVIRLMMDGPINQIRNSKAWQKAMGENFSGMELAMLDKMFNSKKQLCIGDTIYQWKYDGNLGPTITKDQNERLDEVLRSEADKMFTDQPSFKHQLSSLDLSQRIDLRNNAQLKQVLTEKQWELYHGSFSNRDKYKYLNVPVTAETKAEFERTKRQPAEMIEETFIFKDEDGKPAENLEIGYVGFYIKKDVGTVLNLASFHKLAPVQTDENGACVLVRPKKRKVISIYIQIKDKRYSDGRVKLEIEKDTAKTITLTKRPAPEEDKEILP